MDSASAAHTNGNAHENANLEAKMAGEIDTNDFELDDPRLDPSSSKFDLEEYFRHAIETESLGLGESLFKG